MTPDRAEQADLQADGVREMAPLLSAYLDDRLDPAGQAHVEAWLDRHPDSRTELEEIRQVMRLWQAVTPPEPDPAAWEGLRGRIKAQVFLPKDPRDLPTEAGARRRRGAWVLSLAGACAAAAAVLAVLAAWPDPTLPPGAGPAPTPPGRSAVAEGGPDEQAEEPFPVMGDHEVNIISMDAGDADALALGEDPMLGEIELTRLEDVTLIQVGPGQEDRAAAQVQRGPFPMIVPVLASAREQ
jgi:hypothetical protein